jgi:hypothetical protein
MRCGILRDSCLTENPAYILRIERDPEEGHLQGFRNRPEFISFIALVRPYVKDIEEMRHYRVIGEGRKQSTAGAV